MRLDGFLSSAFHTARAIRATQFPGCRAYNVTKHVNLTTIDYQHTSVFRTTPVIWNTIQSRFSSDSAIKHLIYGTRPTSWLYSDRNELSFESSQAANAALVNLVTQRKFGAADRLRLELVDTGVKIDLDGVYEHAALAGLQWSDPETSLHQFTTWFSLVPVYDRLNPPKAPDPFKVTRNELFRSGAPASRLEVILHFGIICASKGYVSPMLFEIAPILCRFISPDVAVSWLHDMECATVKFQEEHQPGEQLIAAWRLRYFSVEFCIRTGWLDQAIAMVQIERRFPLPSYIYNLLCRRLQEATRLTDVELVKKYHNEDMLLGYPRHLEKFTPNPYPFLPANPSKPTPLRDGTSSGGFSHSGPLARYSPTTPLEIQKSNVSRSKVASQLRIMKRSLQTGQAPNISEIIYFLSDFNAVGGSQRVVTWLLERALRSGEARGILWAQAVLRYHNIERNYHEALKLYLIYFDNHDIPHDFQNTLKRLFWHRRFRVRPSELPKYPLRDRWLILKPIIRLAAELPKPLTRIKKLYASYREQASKDGLMYYRSASEILSTFIAVFGELGSVKDAESVFADVGDVPYLRQVETLASALARAGRVEEAMELLRKIEAGAHEGTGDKRVRWKKGLRVMSHGGRLQIAAPRLATYGQLIGGFAAAGLLQPALEVESLMMRRFAYEHGLNRRLDLAMNALWRLEMETSQKQARKPSILL